MFSCLGRPRGEAAEYIASHNDGTTMTTPTPLDLVMQRCETLMLDMDGTLLDLAFDNFMWRQLVPERYAARHGLDVDAARDYLFGRYGKVQGDLKWYCLDHWSDELDMDLLGLHRDQHARIGFLPGAEDFLAAMHDRDTRVILVTNSHPDTLAVKDEVTGVTRYFDAVYTSHDFGHPKERQSFWRALQEADGFDPLSAVMVDDTHAVLHSARTYGLFGTIAITRPDTTAPERDGSIDFIDVAGVGDLLP